jgi:hypothetical protein
MANGSWLIVVFEVVGVPLQFETTQKAMNHELSTINYELKKSPALSDQTS